MLDCYAPINVNPVGGGGGGAGNRWGFDQEVKIFANFPRVGQGLISQT